MLNFIIQIVIGIINLQSLKITHNDLQPKNILFDKKNKDTIIDDDNYKKILLFPTKNHWKDQSDLTQIEKGLLWLVENYEKLGVTSLAIPALGCGNGGLEWKDVGPIMCRYLDKMKILTHVYLPEKVVSPQYLSNEYLLGAKNKITDF